MNIKGLAALLNRVLCGPHAEEDRRAATVENIRFETIVGSGWVQMVIRDADGRLVHQRMMTARETEDVMGAAAAIVAVAKNKPKRAEEVTLDGVGPLSRPPHTPPPLRILDIDAD